MSRARRYAVRLGLLAGTTILTLGLVEVGFRLLLPQARPIRGDRAFWAYHETLGWAHKPNEVGRFEHEFFSVDVVINSQGLRDNEYSFERVPGKKRILVLGDSMTWGFGVEHPQIFTEILEARLPDCEVINAAVSGYGTDQQYLYMRDTGVGYRPDVVLVVMHENDVINNNNAEQYRHNKPRFRFIKDEFVLTNTPVPGSTFKQRLARFVYGHTYFFSTFYEALKSRKSDRVAKEEERPPGVDRRSKQNTRFAVTEQLLLSFQQLVEDNDGRLAIVSVPTTDTDFRDFLETTLTAAGVSYLPLDATFSQVAETVQIENDNHWNPRGHAIVADAIEEFLFAKDLLGNTPAAE